MKRTGKIGMWVGCGVAMLVLTMAGSASGQIFGDSSEWENKYECNVHPSNAVPSWDPKAGGYGTITTNAGGYINVQITGTEGFLYAPDPGDMDPTSNGGVAFEVRMRVNSDAFILRYDTSGTSGRKMANYIRTFRWTLRDGDNSSFLHETVSFGSFQTIRVECDDTNWRMYENGTLEVTQLSDHDNGNLSGYQLHFDFWFDGTADFDLDYIRWTTGEPDLGTLVTLK